MISKCQSNQSPTQRKCTESQGKPWLSCFSWEQRKFSEFAVRESTFRPSSTDYPSVEYEDVVAEEGRLNKDVRQKETQKNGIVFDGTQVLYGKLRPYLHNWLNPDFTGVAVGDWWVLRPIGIDKKFLYRLIQTQQFDEVANQSSGSKMPRADWNLVSTTEFIIPASVDEQRQIAKTFGELDNLITLHQRQQKLGRLGYWKKTYSWEQRKLSSIAEEVTRTDPESDAPIMMITANNGFIEQSDRYAFNNAGESLKKYILLEKGEMAYNHGASKLRPYGSCFALTTAKNARIPFVYHCFSVGENDSEFVSMELNGSRVENQLRRIVSSGARMDGLLNISYEEYSSVELMMPSIPEQHALADYFRKLDDLITLHQRERQNIDLEVHHVRSSEEHRLVL